MESVSAMQKEFARRFLASKGYVGADALLSLDYCQGSGWCFEWSASGTETLAVLERVIADPEKYEAVKLAVTDGDIGISIAIRQSGSYYHSHAMRADVEVSRDRWWGSPEEADGLAVLYCEKEQNYVRPMTFVAEQVLNEIGDEEIDDDARAACDEIEGQLYKIQEQCSPSWWASPKARDERGELRTFTYRTLTIGRFTVKVKLRDLTWANLYDREEEEPGENDREMQRLLSKELVAADVFAKVIDKEEGHTLGKAEDWCSVIGTEEELRRVIAAVVRDAVYDARAHIEKLQQRYANVKPARAA